MLELSGKHYLTGPVVFVRFNMEGEYVSLTMGDLHCIQEYLEQHSKEFFQAAGSVSALPSAGTCGNELRRGVAAG